MDLLLILYYNFFFKAKNSLISNDSTSEFNLNVISKTETFGQQVSNFLITAAKVQNNGVARQIGINKAKKIKGRYPGRQPIVNVKFYKTYLKLAAAYPNWSKKELYVKLKISKSTFFRMLRSKGKREPKK